jgi:hypothetical protein
MNGDWRFVWGILLGATVQSGVMLLAFWAGCRG